MYTYFSVNDKLFYKIVPFLEKGEDIINKLYGAEKLSREETVELNREYAEIEEQVTGMLKDATALKKFDETECDEIRAYKKANKEVRNILANTFCASSDVKKVLELLDADAPDSLVAALKNLNGNNLVIF